MYVKFYRYMYQYVCIMITMQNPMPVNKAGAHDHQQNSLYSLIMSHNADFAKPSRSPTCWTGLGTDSYCTHPWYVACIRAVHPLILSCLSMSQPLSTSSWAMSSCPAMAANIRGVAPSSGEQASLWLRSWSSMARILFMSPKNVKQKI